MKQAKLFSITILLLSLSIFLSSAELTEKPVWKTTGNVKYGIGEKKDFYFRLNGFLAVGSVTIPLPKKGGQILVTGKGSCQKLIPGKANWQSAQLSVYFKDEEQRRLSPKNILNLRGDVTKKDFSFSGRIPEAAVSVTVEAGIYGKSGSAEFSDIRIVQSEKN